MAIVASVIMKNTTQEDGSRIVFEQHTDNLGVVHELRYAPGAGVDVDAMLTTHAASVAEMLVQAEIGDLLNG